MTSAILKRSVVLGGHKTSVSLEDPFWSGLNEIAYSQKHSVSWVINEIEHNRGLNNLSSAIRLFVLNHYRDQQPLSCVPAN